MVNTELISELVASLNDKEIFDLVDDFIDSNPTKKEILEVIDACQEGMNTVGALFENGKYFIGDVIFAGELQKEILSKLQPIMNEYVTKSNKIFLGIVYGKSQNVGKKIFMSILRNAGFEVVTENK